MLLKNWVVKVLSFVVGGYVCFVALTIDSLGNKTYNTIFVVWGLLAIVSTILLKKYSKIF